MANPTPTPGPYGVTVFSFDNTHTVSPQLFTDMNAIGMNWLRYQLIWSNIETSQTTPASYNWFALDGVVSMANAAGVNIAFTLQPQPQPSWYAKQTNTTNSAVTYASATPFAAFASAVASRYNGSTLSTVQQYNTNPMIIQALEIGNEEWDSYGSGTDSNADGNRAPQYYANVLPAVSSAIRTAYPTCKIGMCAMWWDEFPHFETFLNYLYTNANLKSNVDFLNFHYYPSESGTHGMIDVGRWAYPGGPDTGAYAPSFMDAWLKIQSIMAAHGDSGKEVRMTEGGWYTHIYLGASDRRGTYGLVSYDVQQRNYWTFMDSARLSGCMTQFMLYTMDYASPFVTDADSHGKPISDAYSIVMKATNANAGTTTTYYTPAYTAIANYIARYPDWNIQHNSTPTLLGWDNFITMPSTITGNRARADSTTSFGPASDDHLWSHLSGTGTFGLSVCEGQLKSSGSSILDYFQLGPTTQNVNPNLTFPSTATNQEITFRISTGTSSDIIGIAARLTGTSSSTIGAYTLTVSGTTLAINKVVNGVSTQLAQQTIAQTSGTFYRLRFRVINDASGHAILKGRYWKEGVTSLISTPDGSTYNGSNQILTITGQTQEPNNWTISTTDTANVLPAGGIGFVGRATTATPVQFDSFHAVDAGSIVTMHVSQEIITSTLSSSQTFTASVTQPWASVDVPSGVLAAMGTQTLNISVDTFQLASGTYTDTLTVSTSGGTTLTIPISITIQ